MLMDKRDCRCMYGVTAIEVAVASLFTTRLVFVCDMIEGRTRPARGEQVAGRCFVPRGAADELDPTSALRTVPLCVLAVCSEGLCSYRMRDVHTLRFLSIFLAFADC